MQENAGFLPVHLHEAHLLYLPLPAEAGNGLFQFVSMRCLRTNIMLTTNGEVGSWGEILIDTMVAGTSLDRLLLRSVPSNLHGESHRLREDRARKEQLQRNNEDTRKLLH